MKTCMNKYFCICYVLHENYTVGMKFVVYVLYKLTKKFFFIYLHHILHKWLLAPCITFARLHLQTVLHHLISPRYGCGLCSNTLKRKIYPIWNLSTDDWRERGKNKIGANISLYCKIDYLFDNKIQNYVIKLSICFRKQCVLFYDIPNVYFSVHEKMNLYSIWKLNEM